MFDAPWCPDINVAMSTTRLGHEDKQHLSSIQTIIYLYLPTKRLLIWSYGNDETKKLRRDSILLDPHQGPMALLDRTSTCMIRPSTRTGAPGSSLHYPHSAWCVPQMLLPICGAPPPRPSPLTPHPSHTVKYLATPLVELHFCSTSRDQIATFTLNS